MKLPHPVNSLRGAIAAGMLLATVAAPAAEAASLVYVGTYTNGKSKGIYAYRMDPGSGSFTALGLVAETPNPTFLEIEPARGLLFAANEITKFNGESAGSVSAFAIDTASGKLKPLNQQSSRGPGPCHVCVDATGKNVLVANYTGGSVALLPVTADGHLGAATSFFQHAGKGLDPARQEGPHAHFVATDAANLFAFTCDLGLDQILVYRLDPLKGILTPSDPPFASVKAGSGPRHLAFGRDGRQAYVLNEMTATVTAFNYDAVRGQMKEFQTVAALPEGFHGGFSGAEVFLHPSGKFLYTSNRGANTIAAFRIQPGTGALSLISQTATQGKTPRSFGIDPTGKFLLAANQDSGTIVIFKIDEASGELSPTGKVLEVPSPVCVKFLSLAGK